MNQTWMRNQNALILAANVAGGLLLTSGITACAVYLLLTLASLVLARPSRIGLPLSPARL